MKMSKKEMCYKVKDKTSMKMTGKQSVATEIKFLKKNEVCHYDNNLISIKYIGRALFIYLNVA